jgi:pimeloyl-ACP methyl ester carboxylesterase
VDARRAVRVGLAAGAAALAIVLLTSGPGERRPAPHRSLYVAAGRLRLRAVRAGHGPSLILLHGYGESLIAWRGAFDLLAAHADVTALDLPGFGLSSKPPNGYGTEDLAGSVLAAATALGIDSFVLAGHSMGGTVAVAAARLAPDRVRALVLIDPAGAAPPPMLPESAQTARSVARAVVAEYEAQRARFTSIHDPAWLAEGARDGAYLPAEDSAYRSALSAALREFDFAYLTPERVRAIKCPVLLLWGAFDPVVPLRDGEVLAQTFASARLIVFPRTWHRPHVERPAETADTILAFLRELPRPGSP